MPVRMLESWVRLPGSAPESKGFRVMDCCYVSAAFSPTERHPYWKRHLTRVHNRLRRRYPDALEITTEYAPDINGRSA